MPKKLTKEQIEKIRKLQEQHISDAEISRMMGIPYSTILYQRPEVRERIRERMKEYYQRHYYQRLDPFLLEFQDLLKKVGVGIEVMPKDNPYISIVRYLVNNNYGKKFRNIKRELGDDKLRRRLIELKERGLVVYNEKRWFLSDKGKELCKFLFEPTF